MLGIFKAMTASKTSRAGSSAPSSISPSTSSAPPVAEPDLGRAFDLVMELMPIPGRSSQEQQIATAVIERLKKAGLDEAAIEFDNAHKQSRWGGECGNLIVKFPGTIKGPRRLLTAHLDTVPICVGCQPHLEGEFVRSSNPQTGLGADNRAGSAVILAAALEILARKLPHPPLTFCWFVQEETGLFGSRFCRKAKLGNPKLAFNWDGGSPGKVTIGATGAFRLEIDVQGLASHAGVAPQHGVSAIAIASLAIADLHRAGWHGDIRKGRRLGTSNVGVIQGGEATNVVTDRVHLRAEVRSHDPKFRVQIVRQVERAFARAVREVRSAQGTGGSVKFEVRQDYESFRLDPSEPSVLAAQNAVRAVGLTPQIAISNGGLDANWLTENGIPSVTLGCGQVQPHTVAEALDVEAFRQACRIGLRLATATE